MALEIGKTYYIKNVATGKYLNVYGSDTVANSRNVNTYVKENCLAQKWTVGLYGNGARVYTAINSGYALNINTANNNCTMYLAASNSEADSVVDFLTVNASRNQYRIKMMAYNLYLSVTPSDDNAYWASSADSYSLWQLEDASSGSSSTDIVTTAPAAIVNQTFFVKNFNTGYNLNVNGTDTVADERNVNVYSKENCLAQKWVVRQKSDGAKLFTAINEAFALNINRNTNNCSMYTESTNTSADSVLEFVPYTDATVTAADKVYKIKMANHNRYLDVESVGNGANAYWVESPAYPLWQFVSESVMFPTPAACSSAIKDGTFAIQANGTDFYLNVHGSDTVVDERNVNIYSKDDVLAQRWVPRQTTAGPKLFTKIDETFALNIYTVDGNCTMHTASSNDTDSVLEFESVGTMQYKIKMFNHNKYLAIDGAASGANVVWVDGSANATVWNFIPEATAFPTAAAAPTEIVNTPFFIKNYNTGYNLNVHGVNTVANGRNVNVYAKENVAAQKWKVIQTAKGPKIVTEINNDFSLNIYGDDNPNCTMYTASTSNTDTVLEFEPYTDSTVTAADKVYKIKMFHHGKYLDAAGVGSGYNAFWAEAPTYPLWQFVSEEDMFPPAANAPEEIADKVFFIQNVNTGHFLNVHGTDTVANTRNVNVYAKDNVLAQRWIIRNKSGGPKLVTKIDETFAVNIYANDNNCTMYTEEGNDTDSVLQFIPYTTGQTEASENIYRIKMHYHNRYLTAANTNIGANAYWTAADNEPYALWRLIPESEMTFETVTPTEADSPLVTKFIPADLSNYTACPDGRTISAITIHHTAGNISIDTLGAMWQNPERNASSHYGVRGTQVGQFVNERDIAWTNGHDSNAWCVTIETVNSTGAPEWEVSDDTYYTLVRLVADIAKRNNLGTLVVGENLTYHSFYSATECPGPYLFAKMQDIADRANAINDKSVFIRKLGTQYPLVLTSTASDEGYGVTFSETVSESNQKWIIKDTVEGKEIINAFDTTQNLRLNSTNDAFVVSSDDSLSKAYFVPDEDNVDQFTIKAAINGLSRSSSFKWLTISDGSLIATAFEAIAEWFDITPNFDAASLLLRPSYYPNRRFKIKKGGNYLTFTSSNNSFSFVAKNNDIAQIFEIENRVDGAVIASLADSSKYLSLKASDNTFSTMLPLFAMRNVSPNISFIPYTRDGSSNKYFILSSRYNKFLGLDTSNVLLPNGKLIWSGFDAETVEQFIWELEEPDPVSINDWLVAYYNPQKRDNKRLVSIPNYAYIDKDGNKVYTTTIPGYENIPFKFNDANYWYAFEGKYTLNPFANASSDIYGYTAVNEQYAIANKIDDETYYWIAVGPRVIHPDYPSDRVPMGEDATYPLFGRGTLDAVLSKDGNKYYLRCVVGDIKHHTWNNGIIQTDYSYLLDPDTNLNYDDLNAHQYWAGNAAWCAAGNANEWNGQSCIEFIAMEDRTNLGQYAIDEIFFYDNPIS